MGKLWEINIFNGKTMENHHFYLEHYGKSPLLMGKLWKITIFNVRNYFHLFCFKLLIIIGHPFAFAIA